MSTTTIEAPTKRQCAALNKQGEPCKAPPVHGQQKCAGHLHLGVSANPSANANLANASRRATSAAKREAKQLGFTDVLALKLHQEREALANQWIAEGKRDWRATEGALTRLYGKPKETVELTGGLDLTAMSKDEREALVRQALLDSPGVLEALPEAYRVKLGLTAGGI